MMDDMAPLRRYLKRLLGGPPIVTKKNATIKKMKQRVNPMGLPPFFSFSFSYYKAYERAHHQVPFCYQDTLKYLVLLLESTLVRPDAYVVVGLVVTIFTN